MCGPLLNVFQTEKWSGRHAESFVVKWNEMLFPPINKKCIMVAFVFICGSGPARIYGLFTDYIRCK